MVKFDKTVGRGVLVAALVFAGLAVAHSAAQEADETSARNQVRVTDADATAAVNVKFSSTHFMPAGVPGAKEKAAALNTANNKRVAEELGREAEPESVIRKTTGLSPVLYGGDLVSGGGPTVTTAVNHAIYVNAPGSVGATWGNPMGFLTNLFQDQMIHLSDQYTNQTSNGRYTVGTGRSVSYPDAGHPLSEDDIITIVHAAAYGNGVKAGLGTGLGHIYHVFLPPGTDTCFDQSTQCYSPDNFATFSFCAYHTGVTFKDGKTVLFTVEPYQDVDGCAVQTPSPNGQQADSTNSVLSHETFETITDPLPDSGWVNRTSLDLGGAEIGDECQPEAKLQNGIYVFLTPTFPINGKNYEIQIEYSNFYHACAAQP